jgi:glycosyltransferase involved in cell wall biosynthesis
MQHPTPLVSVILPTYNRAGLLSRAIQSVLSQTFVHWELIVWDDGSNDHTEEVVKTVSDERTRFFYAQNNGVAYARNRAIEASRGKYLAFLDSDDEWCQDKLADQAAALNNYPAIDILFGDFLNTNMGTGERHRAFQEYPHSLGSLKSEQISDRLFLVRDDIVKSLVIENFIATDTVMLRREILARTGGFREGLRNSEDFELWWRLGLAGCRFGYLDKIQLMRYKSPENLSGASIPACENTIRSLNLCLQEAISQDRHDLRSALYKRYRNTWQNLITLYAHANDGTGTLRAFRHALRYGFRLGTLRLLFQAAWIALKSH